MSSLTIALVTWNSEDDIAECLSSLFHAVAKVPDVRLETVIVDNASSDNTIRVIENFLRVTDQNIIFIKNKDNLGFTKACNQAVKASTGDYIFILNPDTEILNSSVKLMMKYLDDNSDAGVVAPQLVSQRSEIQFSCRTFPKYRDMFFEMLMLASFFPKSGFFSRWKMRYFDHDTLREVDQPMGAALLLKRKVLDSVGGLDERFIMFFNDVDFCKRISDAGFKIIFYPDAKVRHSTGVSVYKDRSAMIKHWNNDCLKYFRKHHYSVIPYFFLFVGLKITGVLRILLQKIKHFRF